MKFKQVSVEDLRSKSVLVTYFLASIKVSLILPRSLWPTPPEKGSTWWYKSHKVVCDKAEREETFVVNNYNGSLCEGFLTFCQGLGGKLAQPIPISYPKEIFLKNPLKPGQEIHTKLVLTIKPRL